MRYVIGFFLSLVMVTVGWAAEAGGIALGGGTTAGGTAAPIPLSTGWVEGFLLLIVWLFVAAILVGPLVGYFGLEPRSGQQFSDDRKVRG